MQPAILRRQAFIRASGLMLAMVALAMPVTGCGGSKRSNHPPPDPRAQFEPKPGSYDYSTSGFERADVLLGVRHNYPRLTRIRVARSPCGYSERWVARRDRWMQFYYCVDSDGSRRLDRLNDYHEFLGYPETLSYRCEGARVPNLARAREGFSWIDRCRTRATSLILRGTVSGHERELVAGRGLEVVHLHITTRSRGHNQGRSVNDSWLTVPDGLLVRRIVTGEAATKTPVGKVSSQERFRLRLRPASRPLG